MWLRMYEVCGRNMCKMCNLKMCKCAVDNVQHVQPVVHIRMCAAKVSCVWRKPSNKSTQVYLKLLMKLTVVLKLPLAGDGDGDDDRDG
jgi:hypothetical protein